MIFYIHKGTTNQCSCELCLFGAKLSIFIAWKNTNTESFFSTALGYGVLAVGAAFMAGNLGGVLQTAIAVTNSVAGPLLAAFVMALFMPFTNAKVSCSCGEPTSQLQTNSITISERMNTIYQ